MTTTDPPRFLAATVNWAQQRNRAFKYYWPVKGGWEGWMQVELAAFMLSLNSTLEILREQPIFTNPRMRVDLLLNTDQDTDDQIPVEMKCESFENRMDPFVNGVREDIRKLNEDRTTDFSECTCIMLAAPFSEPSLNAVLGIQDPRGHTIFRSIFLGEVAICASIYTEAGGWNPPPG